METEVKGEVGGGRTLRMRARGRGRKGDKKMRREKRSERKARNDDGLRHSFGN